MATIWAGVAFVSPTSASRICFARAPGAFSVPPGDDGGTVLNGAFNTGMIDLGERGKYAASYAVDGNPETRWSSAFSDPQWIYVDLGQSYSINRVRLSWEAAYGQAYQIQVSSDAVSWTTIYGTTTGTGGVNDLAVSGIGRYVRVYGTVRGTPYGYSLWEFEVYGQV